MATVTRAGLYDGVTVRSEGRDTVIDWTTLYRAARQDDEALRDKYRPLWDAALSLCPTAPRTDGDVYRYANGLPPYSRPVDPEREAEGRLVLASNAAAMRGDMLKSKNLDASLRDMASRRDMRRDTKNRSRGNVLYDLSDPDLIDALGL